MTNNIKNRFNMQKNRIITDWLEKYGNLKIEKQVKKELHIYLVVTCFNYDTI